MCPARTPDRPSSQKRTAIVTGAAGGIGQAIVHILASRDANILAVDKSQGISNLFANQQNVRTIAIDLTSSGAAQEIVANCIAFFHGIDILVNNAGVVIPEPIDAITDAAWETTLAVNTTAIMRLSRAAASELRSRQWGRIINIGSTSSAFAESGHASYCASKHALAGLTKAMAFDLGDDGITANYIMPGFIATSMALDNYDSELIEEWSRKTALGRIGTPEDVANVVAFLASESSDYITGAGIFVDGGHSLHE